MKLECLKKDLEEAVETTTRIVSNTTTLPILKCIVFEATSNKVLLRSTNLELGIEKKLTAQVQKEGSVAIPAQITLSTLKTFPNQSKVQIELIDTSLVFKIGGTKTTIKTIPLDDFPTIPHLENKNKYTLPKESIIKGVRNVLYSASTSLIKPELASIYIYQENDSLIFVATDSFRLAEQKIQSKSSEEIPPTIIPVKNTIELVRILETQQEEDITIYFDENQCSLETQNLYITSRIIDGSFPDYKSILPKKTTTEVVVLKEDLLQTVKKSQIFSDKFGQINLHIYPKKKTFTISAHNTDIGEIFDSLEAVCSGEDLDISFNYKYLLDVFQSFQSDSITLRFSGIGKPLVITGVGNKSFTYLVMPMNR
tara:strand:- start:4821 stop:5924 length:1104 start_codon:yes stop_codon:yes gene_type:complete